MPWSRDANLRRYAPALLLAVYGLALLYGTLTPFDFTMRALVNASLGSGRIEWIPFTYACPVHGIFCPLDRTLNLLAFLPLGTLAASLPNRRSGRALLGRVVAGAFALSLTVETAQAFLPSRFPSSADLLLNTFGALLGAFAVIRLRGRRSAGADRVLPRERGGAASNRASSTWGEGT